MHLWFSTLGIDCPRLLSLSHAMTLRGHWQGDYEILGPGEMSFSFCFLGSWVSVDLVKFR